MKGCTTDCRRLHIILDPLFYKVSRDGKTTLCGVAVERHNVIGFENFTDANEFINSRDAETGKRRIDEICGSCLRSLDRKKLKMETYQSKMIQRLKFNARTVLSREMLKDTEFEIYFDHVIEDMIVDMKTHVCAELVERENKVVKYPATWFQHLKKTLKLRLPRLFNCLIIRETKTTICLKRWGKYPNLNIKFKEHSAIIHEQINYDIEWPGRVENE